MRTWGRQRLQHVIKSKLQKAKGSVQRSRAEQKNNNGKKSQIILVITFWGSTKQRRGKKDVKTFDPRLEAAAFLSSTRERFSFYCFWLFFASNFNFRFIALAQRETLQWGVALDVNGSRVGRKFPAQNINQSRGINSNVYMFRCHFVRDSCIKRQHA